MIELIVNPIVNAIRNLKAVLTNGTLVVPLPTGAATSTNQSTQITQITNVTHENTHTGNDELRVYQENHVCTGNTTTTALGANETFTGQWQDCLNYQEVNVSIISDKNSATNGLVFQWSADGTIIGDTDVYSYYTASGGTNYTPNPAFRYVRMVYTNGSQAQTSFSLMTILRRTMTGGSFHRIDSTLKDDSDGRLTITVPKLKTAANNYVSQTATNSGNAKMSIQEFDGAVATNTNKLNVAPYLTDEAGVQSQMLCDTYYGGAPVTIDIGHHEIHCGDMITLYDNVDLGNAAVRDILIIVPNPAITTKRYHFDITIDSESETDYKLYEGTTVSNAGTALTAYNRNRQDPTVAENEVLYYHTPTVTAVGALIDGNHWGAGRGVGGVVRSQNEWVFKNNVSYLVRITNATATNNQISTHISYYVHPGV